MSWPGSQVERLEDLLAAVARGEQDAHESVYERVVGPVYGVILRVLRDPAQSEEVAQILDVPLGTVKTRMPEGTIRMRDCLGVSVIA